jgi:mRNA interferase MazF
MRINSPIVRRGELYWVDWDAARGSEQSGRRPALVIQEDPASTNPRYPLTIVAAVSTKGRPAPSHVTLEPSPENGLTQTSLVKCEQLMTISKDRLASRIGQLDNDDMQRVGLALKAVLAL